MKVGTLEIPETFNLVTHYMDRHVEEGRGQEIAIHYEDQAYTYAQVFESVNRVGNGLRKLGIREEERVLIVLPDSPEFVAAYLGIIKIGAVAVPTNTILRSEDYRYFLDESRARILIVHTSFWPEVKNIIEDRPFLEDVIVCGGRVLGHVSWQDWLTEQQPTLEAVKTHRDDPAFWLWTSGSTGKPKAAVHLHHDWICCSEFYARGVLDIGANDKTFSSSKLFHAYGLGNALLFPFHVGATTALYPGRPTPEAILQKAHDEQPTLFFSVPTLYAAMLHETEQDSHYDLSSIRLAVSAAEPLPAEIFRRWKDRFKVEILDGIGSTEVLHIYASARAGKVRPGSTGQPVSGYEVRITDENETSVSKGEIGDLWVKGESTAPYYWHRHQLSKQRMQGEWFFTGDKYYLDDDNFLWYAGRSDDMFRVSGQWLSPIEVENTLVEHPAVLESAVVPFETKDKLHKPKAFIVLKNSYRGSDDLVRELQEFVKQRIAPYKYPRQVEFVKSLPKTAAGKIQRFKLRESSNTKA